VVHQAGEAKKAARRAFTLAEQLRSTGLDVVLHCGGGSFKSQMKKADASGAEFALIIGDDELAAGEVTLKPLRGDAAQVRLPMAEAAARIIDNLSEELES